MSSKGQLTHYIKDLKNALREKDRELYNYGRKLTRALDERDKLKKKVKKLEKQIKIPWYIRRFTQLKRFVAVKRGI